jgi:hypothetical protein
MGVELLTDRHKCQIAGVLSGYDRIIIRGTLPKGCCAKGITDHFFGRQIRVLAVPDASR